MGPATWSELDQRAERWAARRPKKQPQTAAFPTDEVEGSLRSHLVRRLLSNLAGKQIVHGTAIMHGQERVARALDSVGMVHRVDTVNRELTIFVNGELLTFDVPVGCQVILHGEPVKLRMVQPQDCVKITHSSRDGLRVARTIEVQSDEIAGRTTRDLSEVDQSAG